MESKRPATYCCEFLLIMMSDTSGLDINGFPAPPDGVLRPGAAEDKLPILTKSGTAPGSLVGFGLSWAGFSLRPAFSRLSRRLMNFTGFAERCVPDTKP
jgi:hypothetical protein